MTDFEVEGASAGELRDAWPAASLWAFEALLPVDRADAPTMGEGATPLVECPWLAEELGVERALLKDEGQNPTGTIADRELALAVAAASEEDGSASGSGGSANEEATDGPTIDDEETDVALPSTGTDAVAAAAYGARAGLDVEAFVPTRCSHDAKALINVHGADMTVVEGRLPDAVEAYESAAAEASWTSLRPGDAPLRVLGAGTATLELLAQLEWSAPDALVVPTGHGTAVAGARRAVRAARELDLLADDVPLYAAQAAGCAPIADAAAADATSEGADEVSAEEMPDTIAGALEVPDPAHGDEALAAVRESGGGAVAVEDDAILEAATSIAAAEGLEASVAGGAAAAAAWELANAGDVGAGDEVAILDPAAGSLDADLLRSHLMRQGI